MTAWQLSFSRIFCSEKGGGSRDILVCGMAGRNRAVHGDQVVLELLPKSEWKAKGTALVQVTISHGNVQCCGSDSFLQISPDLVSDRSQNLTIEL